jgi:general secretion pathway protein H
MWTFLVSVPTANKAVLVMTQTLVLGRISRPAKGFTLIEVLIALLIVGVVMASVGLATGGFRARDLEFEADRIAQLFSLAREEAQVRGRPVRMVVSDIGYQFESFSENQWRVIREDELLRARRWEQPTQVKIETADKPADGLTSSLDEVQRSVAFGREQIDVPFTMRLSRDESVIVIAGDGMGRFKVEKSTSVVPK